MPVLTARSLPFSFLLHLLLPGLGHVFWGEPLFGIFIFLITLLAAILFVVSVFVDLPVVGEVLLFSLPLLFYLFTFVDLTRTVRSRREKRNPAAARAVPFLLVGLAYQLLAPTAAFNFAWRNRPEVFVQPDNRLSPLYSRGDLLKASRFAYMIDVFVVKRPILRALPQRYDVVRFVDDSGERINGLVLGLPGEQIEVAGGVVVADGLPDVSEPPGGIVLTGDCPLTEVDGYCILVVTLNLGRIDEVYEVPLTALAGKIDRLL